MPTEIERKFLVHGDTWKSALTSPGAVIRQGYLSTSKERTVRIRVKGENAWLTIKGPSAGSSRPEFEYSIPLPDAAWMLDSLCDKPLIEKTRYTVEYNGSTFEIDEFRAENDGLVLAEVELTAADQHVDLPDWIAEEVTRDPRYYNSNLARNPGAWRQPQ